MSKTAQINVAGGTGTKMYSIDGATYQASNTFSDLADGSYTAYVKDANDCVATRAFNVQSTNPIIEFLTTGIFRGPNIMPWKFIKDGSDTYLHQWQNIAGYGSGPGAMPTVSGNRISKVLQYQAGGHTMPHSGNKWELDMPLEPVGWEQNVYWIYFSPQYVGGSRDEPYDKIFYLYFPGGVAPTAKTWNSSAYEIQGGEQWWYAPDLHAALNVYGYGNSGYSFSNPTTYDSEYNPYFINYALSAMGSPSEDNLSSYDNYIAWWLTSTQHWRRSNVTGDGAFLTNESYTNHRFAPTLSTFSS